MFVEGRKCETRWKLPAESKTFFTLAEMTGMCPTELLGLQIGDLDFGPRLFRGRADSTATDSYSFAMLARFPRSEALSQLT
jgi:integrase